MSILNFVHLGNGITVYRKDMEIDNDYLIVAHISNNRVIDFKYRK